MRFNSIMALAGAGLLAGCGTRPQPPAPAPPVSPSVPAPAPEEAATPAAYLSAAASGDLFVVRASELALQRLPAGAERRRAEMLIGEHRGMAAQLSMAGRRLNLLPAATLLPRHQARLSALQASGDFAPDYHRHVLAVHEELSRLHLAFAARGSSPTLRPVASAAAARVLRHRSEIR